MSENKTFEGLLVRFPNFRGLRTKFKPAGERGFNAVLDDAEIAQKLISEGWNLKPLFSDAEEDDAGPYGYSFYVKVNYLSSRPPKVYTVGQKSGKPPVLQTDETVPALDFLPIAYCDITVNPYRWTVGGNSGIQPYLINGYFIIEEDILDIKWATEYSDVDYE